MSSISVITSPPYVRTPRLIPTNRDDYAINPITSLRLIRLCRSTVDKRKHVVGTLNNVLSRNSRHARLSLIADVDDVARIYVLVILAIGYEIADIPNTFVHARPSDLLIYGSSYAGSNCDERRMDRETADLFIAF